MVFLATPVTRRVLTALTALLVAFGAGHLMQSILVERTPLATVEDIPDAAQILRSNQPPETLPTPPAATLTPILASPPIMQGRAGDGNEASLPQLWQEARLSPFGFSCDPELSLSLREAAMIDIRLFAPCDPEAAVTLTQADLSIGLRTDAYGRAATTMPALSDVVAVVLETGRRSAQATTLASEARAFARVVLVWEGPRVFGMHAFEFGAKPGESGHIWNGAPKTAARATRGTGGFMVEMGDGSGKSAQVYTFPTGHSPLRGVVELIVQADITETTCGQMARATALQTGPLGGMTETDVRVTLPDCNSVGDILELKNLLQDMRLAER